MPILNESLDFRDIPLKDQQAFIRQQARKMLLHPGHALYKFTEHPLYRPDGAITEWWFSVKSLAPNDPGWAGSQQRANNVGAPDPDFARVRGAVTNEWNSMENLQKTRLILPVYAFFGQCAHQPVDKGVNKVVFIGGAYQLYIPYLTRSHIVPA